MTDKDKDKMTQGKHPQKEKPHRHAAAQEQDSGPGRDVAGVSAEIHEEVVRERDEYLDALKRLQAEFDNFRKRVIKENEQISRQASAEVVQEVLPVLDNFERAVKAAIEHDEEVLSTGVELVYNQLRDILYRRGLCEIEAEGATFDPTLHEAVLCKPSREHEEGKVTEVLEKGYHFHDRVMRPARVVVSSGNDESSNEGPGDSDET